MPRSVFVVSLDLELYWGVRDRRTVDDYRANLGGVWAAVPRILELFEEYGVHATWAAVGMLGQRDAGEALAGAPRVLPGYADRALCPYAYLRSGGGKTDVGAHFAPDLIETILRVPGQELGTHTYSHFYCLEEPMRLDAFRADLDAAREAARARFGVAVRSLVFPRNQYSAAHVRVAGEAGIVAYRGNPDGWMYEPAPKKGESPWRRGARLVDAYAGVAGDLSFALEGGGGAPFNVAASRFLRPWSERLAWAEGARLGRIEREMRAAARGGRGYHLWWHPHNFGVRGEENLGVLRRVLEVFRGLAGEGMVSCGMGEVAASRSVAAAAS